MEAGGASEGRARRGLAVAFQVAVAASTLLALAVQLAPAGRVPRASPLELLAWTAMIAGVDLLSVPATSGLQLTVSFPLMLATVLLFPPWTAALIALLGSFDARELRGGVSLLRALFNRSQMALAILAAGGCFHALAGPSPPLWRQVPLVLLAAAVAYALNTAVVAVVTSLLSGVPLWTVLRRMHGAAPYEFLVSYLSLGLLGVIIAHFAVREGLWSVAVLTGLVVVARQLYFRGRALADRLAENNRLLVDQAGQLERLLGEVSRSEERFRSLVQHASDVITVLDGHGRVRYQSAAVEQIFGYRDDELLGRRLHRLVHPGDRVALRQAAHRLPGADAPVEVRVRHRGGGWRQTETIVTNLLHDPGVRGLVLNTRDVTERKRLELELRHAQKLESLGRLAGGVAHEINTPIQFIGDNLGFLADAFQGISGLLATYRQAAHDGAPAPVRSALQAAEDRTDLAFLLEEVPAALQQTAEGVSRVASIVRAMKAFGHLDQRVQAAADLNEALRNAALVAHSQLKGVADVGFDLDPLPAVVCYLSDLNQVFLNLLVNAADAVADAQRATPGGRGRITLGSRLDGDHAVVSVADTGCGIPDDIREQVFDPFFTTKEVGRGTGQGLALAHTIVVERHGGTITFDSEPGRGTTFSIRLPVAGVGPPRSPAHAGG